MDSEEIKELKRNASKSVEMAEAYKVHVDKILNSVTALQARIGVGIRMPNSLTTFIKADELFLAPDSRLYLLGSDMVDSVDLKTLPSDLVMRVINEALPLLSAAAKKKADELSEKVDDVEKLQAEMGGSSASKSKDLMESAAN